MIRQQCDEDGDDLRTYDDKKLMSNVVAKTAIMGRTAQIIVLKALTPIISDIINTDRYS